MDKKEKRDYIKEGYRIVSRKYGRVARLDRTDWKEFLIKEYPNFKKGMTDLAIADFYRRVYSKDEIELGKDALTLKIPNSGDVL